MLAIDIGNSQLHIGWWQDEQWQTWRIKTDAERTADEYAVVLRGLLGDRFAHVRGVVIASVVPRLTDAFGILCQTHFGITPLVVDYQTPMGIPFAVDAPEKVGIDRVVNLVAAKALYGQLPAVVVDFGTATTLDVLSAEGAFIGGAICAGLRTSVNALAGGTANLYGVPLQPPPHVIGRNTTHALQSGLFVGYVALIEGLLTRITAELGQRPLAIATGGLSRLFDGHTSAIDAFAPLLTLDGLRLIWLENTGMH